jgi:hypothetical protein
MAIADGIPRSRIEQVLQRRVRLFLDEDMGSGIAKALIASGFQDIDFVGVVSKDRARSRSNEVVRSVEDDGLTLTDELAHRAASIHVASSQKATQSWGSPPSPLEMRTCVGPPPASAEDRYDEDVVRQLVSDILRHDQSRARLIGGTTRVSSRLRRASS